MVAQKTEITPAKQFDLLARLADTIATGTTSTTTGRQPIRLRAEPKTLDPAEQPRSMAMVARDLVAVFRGLVAGQLPWPLYLHGPAGSGKTCAARALGDFAEEAFFVTVEQICDAIVQNDKGLLDLIRARDLVVLDELGTRNAPSDLEYKAVKLVADARESRRNRVGVYISNLPPQEIPVIYDDRIASRILCGTIFHLATGDQRRRS